MIDKFYYKMYLGKKNKQRQRDPQQSEKKCHTYPKGRNSLDTRGEPSKSRKVGKGHGKKYIPKMTLHNTHEIR